MHYPILTTKNWNGSLLNDSWRITKPESADYYVGAQFEIRDTQKDGVVLGLAKIAAISKIRFSEINDNIAFSIIGKPAIYYKTVLFKMYGFVDHQYIHILTMAWTERVLEAHRMILQIHWDHIVKETPKHANLFSQINLQQPQA